MHAKKNTKLVKNINPKKKTLKISEKKSFLSGFKQNLFTLLTKFLVIILPFYVILQVFFKYKVWISNFWFFIKEFVIILLIICLIYEFFKKRKFPKLDIIDYLIFSYIWYWVIITLINWLWIKSIVYWWRYDFLFFIVFLIFKHWKQFLKIKLNDLVILFIYSASISLIFSILIKFRIWEDSLTIFGFTDYISNWTYNWAIPSYHGLENSWIRRFQWIFDSPNAMWFFLIIYTYLLVYLQKKKDELYVYLIIFIFIWLLVLTYSRSSLLWVILSTWFLLILNLKYLYNKYKKTLLILVVIWLIIFWTSWIIFQEKLKNIILRTSSTTGHFDRMKIWIDRFLEKPLWSWLAESWPAYRNIYVDKSTKEDEQYYIPESWFIQQLIEWWIIYFLVFVSIFLLILKKLYKKSKTIFALLLSILIMNLFLHIFEATYLSILLFVFIWLFTSKENTL